MQVDRATTQDREKLRYEDNPRSTMSPHGPEENRAKQSQQPQAKIGQQKDQGLQQPQQQQAGQVRAGATTDTFKQQGQLAGQQQTAQQPLMQQARAGDAGAKSQTEYGKAGSQAGAKAGASDMSNLSQQQQQRGKDMGHEAPRVGKGDRSFDQSNKESSDFSSAHDRDRGEIRGDDSSRQAQRETDRRIESSQQHRSTDMESGKFSEAGDASMKASRGQEWDASDKTRQHEQAGRKHSSEQAGRKHEVEGRFHEQTRS